MAAKLEWGRHWVGVGGGLVLVNSTPRSKSLAFPQGGEGGLCVCNPVIRQKHFNKGPCLFHLPSPKINTVNYIPDQY